MPPYARFGIVGRIPSKKNSKRIMRGRGGQPFIGCSKDYAKWQKENLAPLKLQFGHPNNGKRLSVTIEFTVGDRRAFDLTNKAESIMDLMVDAGVIDDDSVKVVPSVALKYAGYEKGRWYALVTLEEYRHPSLDALQRLTDATNAALTKNLQECETHA